MGLENLTLKHSSWWIQRNKDRVGPTPLFPPPFEGQSSDKPSTSPVQSDASCMHINTARVLEYLLGLT